MSDAAKYIDPSEMVDPIKALRKRIEDDWPDTADGAALRRLREALPDGGQWEVTGSADTQVFIGVSWPVPDHLPDGAYFWDEHGRRMDSRFGEGPTLAEAADKCREALEGKG